MQQQLIMKHKAHIKSKLKQNDKKRMFPNIYVSCYRKGEMEEYRTSGNKGLVFKIDFAKACDRVLNGDFCILS